MAPAERATSWTTRKAAGVAISFLILASALACSTVVAEKPSCLFEGCGVHGQCVPRGETSTCVCDPGYVGSRCEQCDVGLEDSNHNGFCLPSCAKVTCQPHAQCSATAGRGVCSCVVGYTRQDDGTCLFTGGPVDPSFDDPQPNGWVASGAAMIESARGRAQFAGDGEVFQSFEMPALKDAEPLALAVDFACLEAQRCSLVSPEYLATFDDHAFGIFFSYGSPDMPASPRVCLGERAFGRTLKLGLKTDASGAGDVGGEAFVKRMQFVSAPECPAPGTVKNGDFALGSWSRDVPLVELNGSPAAQLTSVCTGAVDPGGNDAPTEITTTISVPEKLEHPALVFSMSGTSKIAARLSVGQQPIGTHAATATAKRVVTCLPQWTLGFAFDLNVALFRPYECVKGNDSVLQVGDFVLASEPACESEAVIDGGFERGLLPSWNPRAASIVRSEAGAHSGQAHLELRTACTWLTRHETANVKASLTVPFEAASTGTALKFWYRLSPTAVVEASVPEATRTLAPAATWTQQVHCLSPRLAGRRSSFGLVLYPSSSESECQPRVLEIDDVTIEPDASCLGE